jgi:hypothetical protein
MINKKKWLKPQVKIIHVQAISIGEPNLFLGPISGPG